MDITGKREEVGLSDYLRVLYRRRYIAIISFLAVFLVTAIHTLTTTPIYQAYALVQVETETSQSTLLSDLAKLGKANPIAAEMEIIKSRTVAEDVVRELRLDRYILDAPGDCRFSMRDLDIAEQNKGRLYMLRFTDDTGSFEVVDDQRGRLGEGKEGERFSAEGVSFLLEDVEAEKGHSFRFLIHRFQRAAEGIQATVRIQEVGEKTNIIMVTYRHKDPERARDIVNKIVDVYLRRNIDQKSLEASQTLEFIEKQLQLIQSNLEKSEDNLHRYKTDQGVMLLSQEATALIENQARFEVQRSQMELERFQAENLLEAFRSGRNISGSFLLPSMEKDELLLSQLSLQLAQQEVDRKALLEEFTDEHPQVLAITASIRDLREKIEQILVNTVSSIQSRQGSLDDVIRQYTESLRQLPLAEKELASLTRTSEVNANIYRFLLEKHEEARIAKAATVGNLRVIDYAVKPSRPVKPKTRLNLLLGLMAGLVLSVGAAFLLDYFDDSLKTLEEVERLVGRPIYGIIPRISMEDKNGETPASASLITRTSPKSPISEAFRTLRTNIQFSSLEKRVASILVTSAGPSEGKSTIVSNLSLTMANFGMKTLLIDGDLRKPYLHKIFDADRDPGLTNVLTGEAPWKEAVRPTAVENLSLMTSGPIPPNPTEMMGSRRMEETLREILGEYDMILFDSPPVLAVTDAAILSSMVDGTLLVVEMSRARAEGVNRAIGLLENVKAKLLGLVTNNISVEYKHDYGYYSYYYYYSDTGERRRKKGRRHKGKSSTR